MDECAARLEPLTDQYKPIQHQTFEIEIFLDLIVTTRSSPGDKKSHWKKFVRTEVLDKKFQNIAKMCIQNLSTNRANFYT